MQRRIGLAAAILHVALVCPAIRAADGVIEINQASVEASGGFPFTIANPGSYILTGNLKVEDGDADGILVQTEDGVTIDLNGFEIDGQGSSGFGVSSRRLDDSGPLPFGNVAIRDGTVRGFKTGVWISSGVVEGVRALSNTEAGILAFRSHVTNCVARENGGAGIQGMIVADSEATGNQGVGIIGSESPLVTGNVAGNNVGGDDFFGEDSGVQISADHRALVLNNTANAPSSDAPAIFMFPDPDTQSFGPNDPPGGYAGNVVSGEVVGGIAIGCNTINGAAVCPSGDQN